MPRLEFGPLDLSAIADGEQAVKLVRARAKEFGVDPQRIGIIGFSAGGAVAGGASVRAEPVERPNFVGIIYGGVPGAIPAHAPPAFLAAAADDPLSDGLPIYLRGGGHPVLRPKCTSTPRVSMGLALRSRDFLSITGSTRFMRGSSNRVSCLRTRSSSIGMRV